MNEGKDRVWQRCVVSGRVEVAEAVEGWEGEEDPAKLCILGAAESGHTGVPEVTIWLVPRVVVRGKARAGTAVVVAE